MSYKSVTREFQLTLKQAPYEFCSLCRTEVMIIFGGDSVLKMHFFFLQFSHPCTIKLARHKPLIFWKNMIFYEVYKFNFHWNMRRINFGLVIQDAMSPSETFRIPQSSSRTTVQKSLT
jgi:hypothetical protein